MYKKERNKWTWSGFKAFSCICYKVTAAATSSWTCRGDHHWVPRLLRLVGAESQSIWICLSPNPNLPSGNLTKLFNIPYLIGESTNELGHGYPWIAKQTGTNTQGGRDQGPLGATHWNMCCPSPRWFTNIYIYICGNHISTYGFFNIRTGILDYLREGFLWPARPLKHTDIKYTN